MRLFLPLATSVVAFLAGCSDAPSMMPAPKAAIGDFGLDTTAIDTTVKPGDDFFRFFNGKWLASAQIPATRSRHAVIDTLIQKTLTDLRALMTELAAANPGPGTTQRKMVDLYESWMDEATIEARGIEPLQPYFTRINGVGSRADLMALVATGDFTMPFSISIGNDPNDPMRHTVWVEQGGLGMPNRDYYLKEGDHNDQARTAYKSYVSKIFELIADPDPAQAAEDVIGFENLIAMAHWTLERQRVIQDIINPMDRAELTQLAPAVDWDVLLEGYGLGGVQNFIVAETTAIHDSALLIETTPLNIWKKYLTFHLVRKRADSLPKAFRNAFFEFYFQTLVGVEKQTERWEDGIETLNTFISDGLGEAYVARHFSPDHKIKIDELVANLRAALQSRLETLEWMDDATRTEALKKLASFKSQVGHPDQWRDYTALTIEKGKLFENLQAAYDFYWKHQVARLNQSFDPDEWVIPPQMVNAFYNPLKNQITFPAAILQPPFFDPHADPAVNYGAIGGVIGHEIGHGFDDEGREFDGNGLFRNWWTEETDAKFRAIAERLVVQYNAFCPLPDVCVNGQLTLGENFGDLGGLQMAYTAYKRSLGSKEAPVLDGLTGDQRFFMSWAQIWRALHRDEDLRNHAITGHHAPPMYRVNGVLPNIDAWYEAFGVQEGDEMYLPPEQRVRIW